MSIPQLRRRSPQQRRGRRSARPRPEAAAAGSPAGNCCTRRRKLASMRLCSGSSPGRPKPPARLAGDSSRGSSSSASGLPRASARIRPRTRSSSGASMTEASSSRASPSDSPAKTQIRQPRQLVELGRLHAPRTRARPSRLRAAGPTNASTSAEEPIEPLGVIDQAQQRELLGGLGQQAEHRQTDEETVGLGARAQARRRSRARRAAGTANARGGPAAVRTADADPRTGSSISDSTPTARTTR